MEQLTYRYGDMFTPIPPSEQGLPTIRAEYFAHVGEKPFVQHSEGLCFDREGNLYYCFIGEGKVFRLDMKTKQSTLIYHDEHRHPVSVRIHKDGRLFVSCFGAGEFGGILVMNPDGSDMHQIISNQYVDDLIFMPDGSFYYTDCVGDETNRSGGVYRCENDYKTTSCLCRNMRSPNGIALSKEGTHLWVTEYMGGELHRISLNPSPTVAGTSSVAYHFTGCHGPDSCSTDDDGNLYVAMQGQGRVLVFNQRGIPIGQILLPGRFDGHNLCCSSAMVRPDACEVYITSCDDRGDGPWIFRAGSYASGNTQMFQFA